jgi:2-haloacid dehalogenase
MARVHGVIFDLGGVILDWNPRHLYRRLFSGDEAAMERFLAEVCTSAWNEELDRGLPFDEGVARLQRRHPQHAALVAAWRDRWGEMLAGEIAGAPELLLEVKAAGVPVYALSNWSAETWPQAERRFPILAHFDGVVISGREGLIKPDPAIYRLLLGRYNLAAGSCLFIDDSPRNVEGARRVGLAALRFESVPALRAELARRGVLPCA